MEFTSVQNVSKIWTPTLSELQELSINKYNKNINRVSLFPSYLKIKLGQENSFQTLILRLTKKFIRIDKRNSFELMEEDALQLDTLYKREKYLQPEVACAICNCEKIERNLVFEMQKEIEITKLVRNFFMMMDSCRYFSLCLRHRSYYAHFNLKCALGCPGTKYSPPRLNYIEEPITKHYDIPIQKPLLELNPVHKNNDVFYIPHGENPAEYMALNFNWDDYMKQFKMPETRMPYTNTIKLTPQDNYD